MSVNDTFNYVRNLEMKGKKSAKSKALQGKSAPSLKQLMKQNPKLKPDGKGNLSYH